jgi:hypothetical protein
MREQKENMVKVARMQSQAESVQSADLEAAVDSAITACDGDARATVRALVIVNDVLSKQNDALSAELEYAWQQISPGFSRQRRTRRMKSGDPD